MLGGGSLERASDSSGFSAAHIEKLKDIARAVGSSLPSGFMSSCESFLGELAKWNRRINLISPRDRKRIVERHVLDSLCLLAYESRLANKRILDVGSGAGFPGLVLAMWDRGAQVVLVESRSKPVAFLRTVRRTLDLSNVEVMHARIESAVEPGRVSPVDIVTSRAVGGTAGLAELVLPILKPGGAIVVYTARHQRAGAVTSAARSAASGLAGTNGRRQNTRNVSSRKTAERVAVTAAATAVATENIRALERLGLGIEFLTPTWQSLTTLLILRKLA